MGWAPGVNPLIFMGGEFLGEDTSPNLGPLWGGKTVLLAGVLRKGRGALQISGGAPKKGLILGPPKKNGNAGN